MEFGDEQYPNPIFQGPPSDGSTDDVTGPLHNEIPAPDRSVDNSTLWKKDYDVAHYEDMYFNRMAKYYQTQSSGRYSVEGDVTDWVKVPFNEALYGRNYCGGIVCNTSKVLVRDAMAVWVQQQLDDGKTAAQVADYLKTFDAWDRYDLDGDGNFKSPTATSTTSRSSTQVVTRRRATRTRAPTPSGATAGTRRCRRVAPAAYPAWTSAPTAVSSRAASCRTTRPASGSATTPCSPRTAVSASSPTSTATTLACPTSTTPPATPVAPRTRPASGR